MAVDGLYDTEHGKILLELMEDMAGYYAPNYNPENSTTILTAVGRTEMMQTIRNFRRLTEEQIVELFKEGTR